MEAAVITTELAASWVRRWDAQQELYIADREERFAVIGDVVSHVVGGAGVVLDLGCGPGSLAGRLAERLPSARIVGVDADPVLLALGRGRYGGSVEFVDADLTTASWPSYVPDSLDAAVSTTALHWLAPEDLARVYAVLAARLRPGGVFVNGDHLPLGDAALDEFADIVRDARSARAGVTENEDWSGWWAAARAEPALAGLVDERSERALAHHGGNRLTVWEHADLLRAAGFRSAGPIWQSGDDHVLVAIR
jgi:SAM-dependent methyltransferase